MPKTIPIHETIQVGEPVEHGSAAVLPLFPRRRPRAEYVTLDEAVPLGLRVMEVDESGAVPELLLENPLEASVLLYDGEELVGAKQNRVLSVTVLAPAGAKTRIPVACVEEGRWSRRSAFMAPAPHASFPDLRRRKAERLAADPFAVGAAQGEVWASVAAQADRLHAHSPTGAQEDVFRQRGGELAELRAAFPLQPGQSGALFTLGGEACLDYVSQPDAFARLYPKLLDGYLLDALGRHDGKPASGDAFVKRLQASLYSRRPSVGLGDDLRLRGDGVVGSGLQLDGELVQLCAFTSAERRERAPIGRPSRRRG